ncbi:MAG: chromate transporter [Solobacterium sp.]|jgi:chromate transporter|nr:chromate transporter [Solobacterium sp.]MCH4206115.1 chromate transporter [Solobacterium sp.]MCH4227581.1 chromate transporter [Solobacterium sp.]MCH4283005.1 chromate transporter [Solobacterium sp.]
MEKKKYAMVTLFFSMLTISAFTFGGGFVIISMMRKKFCDELHWVTDEEVLDMTAIAQSAPGALAVNSAVIFGYRIAGLKGALLSVLATIIPPIVIISIVVLIYNAFASNVIIQTALRVMRAGVGAIITDVVLDLAGNIFKTKNIISVVLMAAAFIASWFFGVSSIALILIFIVLGIAKSLLPQKEASV